MSDEDMETLCGIFYNLPFEELHAMDTLNYPWLLKLKGLSLLPSVNRICCSLKAVQDTPVRLKRTATLYSWLIPRNVYRPWILYRISALLEQHDVRTVGSMLHEAVQSFSGGMGDGIDIGTAVCITVLTERSPLEYSPVCLCIWRGLPFLAVHAADVTSDGASHRAALASVIGDLENCWHGIYTDLRSAHSAAAGKQIAPVVVKRQKKH